MMSEIEIRFQFQAQQDNREGLDWSSLKLTREQGRKQRDIEFVVTRDREALAGAVFRWAAHYVC